VQNTLALLLYVFKLIVVKLPTESGKDGEHQNHGQWDQQK